MREVDPKAEAFFCGAAKWRAEMAALRAILLDGPLTEDFKWRSPCYTYLGGNVATIWAMKECCGLSFFKGVLLKDPAGVLVAPGENSRSVRLVKFTDVARIAGIENLLNEYVLEAARNEKAGRKVEFGRDDLEPPAELTGMLDADPALKAAFEALTPGRRRGYILHFSGAKGSSTRVSRIVKSVPRILAGKGMHDR